MLPHLHHSYHEFIDNENISVGKECWCREVIDCCNKYALLCIELHDFEKAAVLLDTADNVYCSLKKRYPIALSAHAPSALPRLAERRSPHRVAAPTLVGTPLSTHRFVIEPAQRNYRRAKVPRAQRHSAVIPRAKDGRARTDAPRTAEHQLELSKVVRGDTSRSMVGPTKGVARFVNSSIAVTRVHSGLPRRKEPSTADVTQLLAAHGGSMCVPCTCTFAVLWVGACGCVDAVCLRARWLLSLLHRTRPHCCQRPQQHHCP